MNNFYDHHYQNVLNLPDSYRQCLKTKIHSKPRKTTTEITTTTTNYPIIFSPQTTFQNEEDGHLISKQEGKFFLLYVNSFVVDDLIR